MTLGVEDVPQAKARFPPDPGVDLLRQSGKKLRAQVQFVLCPRKISFDTFRHFAVRCLKEARCFAGIVALARTTER